MIRTARDILRDKGGHMLTVAYDATIHQALTLMTQHRVGSILVVDGEKIKGIWTERDLMFRALEDGFDARTALIKERVSENLISASADEVVDQLFDKFLAKRIRHLLIKDDGEFVGLISVGDVMKANLQQKAEEFAELNHKVSLEYYENWKQVQAER